MPSNPARLSGSCRISTTARRRKMARIEMNKQGERIKAGKNQFSDGYRIAFRLYGWAKNYVSAGAKRISLEQVRKVLGLVSIRDAGGNIIRRPPLPVWTNLHQRALDATIRGINAKTDLHMQLESSERSALRGSRLRQPGILQAHKGRVGRGDG